MNTLGESFDKTWLVIPTADRHVYLTQIFDSSEIPPERRILIRTTPGDDVPGAINLKSPDVFNIQSWWNLGIRYAKSHGAEFVAVLNDDTEIVEGQLKSLLGLMIDENTDLCHPDPSMDKGWGHCFLIRCGSDIAPDERFVWWCGDHDLEMQARRKNGVSISPISVPNLHSNEYTSQNSSMKAIVDADIAAFRRKYPLHTFQHEILPRAKRKLKRIFTSPRV